MARRRTNQPDSIQCQDQLDALQATLHASGMEAFCAAMIWILTKIPSKISGLEHSRLVPFSFNRIQRHLYKNLARNNRCLKGRQAGLTTFMMLVRLFVPVITNPGKTALLLSQKSMYAQKHFMMARRALKNIGALDPYDAAANEISDSLKQNVLHTVYSNRRELVFDWLDSSFIVESAEVEEVAQGVTVHHALASEVARYPGNPEATMSNLKGAIVPDGTLDEESTGNGMGGYFYERCMASMEDEEKADARFHYYDWFWSDEYTLDIADIAEAKALLADLEADERKLIARIYRDLKAVA